MATMPTFALGFVWLLCTLLVVPVVGIRLPDAYDVSWTTPSNNSAGSMPVGGGDIGLNVWSENGLLFHLQ